jgi:hypothetical protein
MSSAKDYRVIAQDCLRMAVIAEDDRDRPLWVTMAQSWIQLAEHVSRMNIDLEAEAQTADSESGDDGNGGHHGDGPDWSQTPN